MLVYQLLEGRRREYAEHRPAALRLRTHDAIRSKECSRGPASICRSSLLEPQMYVLHPHGRPGHTVSRAQGMTHPDIHLVAGLQFASTINNPSACAIASATGWTLVHDGGVSVAAASHPEHAMRVMQTCKASKFVQR